MPDKRTEKTTAAIKKALLELMREKPSAQVDVTELVRRAGVGRSTFYEHFSGVGDVYEALMADFEARTMKAGFSLKEAEQIGCKTAYCRQLRGSGPFGPLAHDPGYFQLAIAKMRESPDSRPFMQMLVDAGVDEDIAWALQVFQIAGCYAAAMEVGSDEDWARVQPEIDRFIRGGMAALSQPRR